MRVYDSADPSFRIPVHLVGERMVSIDADVLPPPLVSQNSLDWSTVSSLQLKRQSSSTSLLSVDSAESEDLEEEEATPGAAKGSQDCDSQLLRFQFHCLCLFVSLTLHPYGLNSNPQKTKN